MANGIDSVAHKTCLEHGGKTIAVLEVDLKHIFPKENEELFHQIIKNDGLIISRNTFNWYTCSNEKFSKEIE